MDVNIAPLAPLLKELSQKNIMHAPDFAALQVSPLFSATLWCLYVHSLCVRMGVCVRVCATASYLPCLSRVKGKWGWPRLESNNYLGHACVRVCVCVPYATITGSSSWHDDVNAASARMCTQTRGHAAGQNSGALSWRCRAAVSQYSR